MPQIPSLQELDRRIAEGRLSEYIKRGWHTVETASYQHNWHIDAIADHLEAVARREIRRLIINIPPRHMKSLSCGVFFPSWVWAQNPDPNNEGHGLPIRPGTWMGPGVKFLTFSHKVDLSERDAMLSRRVMTSPWYQGHWGRRVAFAPDEGAKGRYRNTAMGARYTGSTNAGSLGEGGDIVMIDDPHPTSGMSDASREATLVTYSETIKSRVNDPVNGVFILVMQRLHEQDLTGYILSREMGWDHLCLPEVYERTHPHPVRSSIGFTDPRGEGDLLWSDRFTPEAHREREIEFGPYATAGQLQQRPAPREGGLFKKWWFVIQRAAPGGGVRARRWDLAATEKRPKSDPDWTVGVRMLKTHDGMLWIEDVVRLRGSPLEVEQAILNTARQDGMGVTQWVPQDPGAAGKMVAQRLVRLLQPYPARIAQEGEMGDKIARADPFAGQAEAGNVVLLKADWNHDFIEEFGLFPNGRHDDQVDAASGAFLALNSTGTPAIRDMIA